MIKQPLLIAFCALALAGQLRADPGSPAPDSPSAQARPATVEELEQRLQALERLGSPAGKAGPEAVTWGVNIDLRYDYAPYKLTTKQQAGTAAQPLVHYGVTYTAGAGALADAPANGYVGGYVKRAELLGAAKLSGWATLSLQLDLASLRLEDTGVVAKGLPLLPYLEVPGYGWDLKAGLYRQPFGLENQTGAKDLAFPERAILDGGYCPAAFASATPVKLVYERILGMQLVHGHSYGSFGYKVQAAVGDSQKDQDPGSAATTGAFGGAISNTYTAATQSLGLTTDQDLSEFVRVGLDLGFFPSVATLSVGASAIHNPGNTALLATSGTAQTWQDTYGVDASLAMPLAQTVFTAEWVCQNSFANDASSYQGSGIMGQFINRGEGWYLQSTTKPLAFFSKDLSNLDLNLRVESVTPNVNYASLPGNGAKAQFTATSVQANTIGLKYSYKGKTYTSFNYSNYALNGDYTAVAGSSLISLQQQLNF